MKCHRIIPLVIAGALLGATPALARDHGPTITINASLGHLLPRPPVIIVRQPERREVVIAERNHRHGHHEHGRRQVSCDERDRRREEVRHRHEHRQGWRDRQRDERVAVVKRGWERWDD